MNCEPPPRPACRRPVVQADRPSCCLSFVCSVDLFARVSNDLAIGLYESLGYRVFRTVEAYYGGGPKEPDENAYGEPPPASPPRLLQWGGAYHLFRHCPLLFAYDTDSDAAMAAGLQTCGNRSRETNRARAWSCRQERRTAGTCSSSRTRSISARAELPRRVHANYQIPTALLRLSAWQSYPPGGEMARFHSSRALQQ